MAQSSDREGMAALCVVAAAALWGVIGVFSRLLGDAGLDSVQIAELRCLVALAGIAAIELLLDHRLPRIEVRDLWMFVGTGLLSIAMFNVLYFTAAEMLTLSMAAVLLYTAPCFVMAMSVVLFKERLTARKLAALGLSFLGCVFAVGLVGGETAVSLAGIAAGVGSGVGYALYSIFGKIALAKYQPSTVIFYTFLVAAICLLPLSDPVELFPSVLSMDVALPALALGLASTLAPYALYTYGLSRMDAGKAAVLAFVEPMVATLAGLMLFGEPLTVLSAIGIALILASVIMLNAGGRGQKH